MPYSHFHDWSFHTHHRRPKGGRHYNAIRRRQRPWRIGFMLAVLVLVVGVGTTFATHNDWLREPSGLTASPPATATAPPDTTPRLTDSPQPTVMHQPTAPSSPTMKPTPTPTSSPDNSEARDSTKVAATEKRQEEHEREIVRLINVERSRRGIGTLTWDLRLQAIARAHSLDMADKNYFSHTNRAGLDYRERAVAAGYRCPNPKWLGVAENIFFGSRGYQHPRDAVESWLGSPLHRRAMLDVTFSRAAIGIHDGFLSGYGHGFYTTLLLC